MTRSYLLLPILLVSFILSSINASAEQVPALGEAQWAGLRAGQAVLLGEEDGYVTGAILLDQDPAQVWTLLSDPEEAPKFIKDMVSSKVLSTDTQSVVVAQKVKVAGFSSCSYSVRYLPNHTKDKMEFKLEEGRIKSMSGSWTLHTTSDDQTLLVYKLQLDAGFFAPQSFVKRSMRKKIPETLLALRSEMDRRY